MKLACHAAAALVLLALSLPVHALRLELLPNPATIGSAGQVAVTVSDLDADQQIVSAYDLAVNYDTSLLAILDVAFGALLGGPLDSLASVDLSIPGVVSLSEVSFLSDSDLFALQGDSVTLATLTFAGLAVGPTSLQFGSVLLTGRGSVLDPSVPIVLEPQVIGTEVSVQAIPEGNSLALVLAALGAAGLCARGAARTRWAN